MTSSWKPLIRPMRTTMTATARVTAAMVNSAIFGFLRICLWATVNSYMSQLLMASTGSSLDAFQAG